MSRYIIYCRKSTESEDRQVLSIESQMNELKRLAERLNLQVVEILSESQSAKSPGRPLFSKMIDRINEGKVDGIICWKLDRLARNPIDGGQIIWMLQKGIIRHIQAYDRSYHPEDNVLLMSVEFGMANQFILDLSKNVKRGLRAKVEKGWLPTLAPIGYLNDKSKDRGKREIIKDPERFDLVRKMWELMLTEKYTPPKILKIATDEWGLRNSRGGFVSRSATYQLFTNPFYYGWFEYPKGSGNWYQGNHEPMITQEEYDRIQTLLGSRGRPRVKRRSFAFTGLIRCGECGAMVTAEEKNQIICSKCKHKFSYNNRYECPKCRISIEEMERPTVLRYVYYHCTKRKHPDCSQRSVEVKELRKQIDQYLSRIHISERFREWATKHLREEHEKEIRSRKTILGSKRKAYDNCLKKLDNLFQLKISPMNTDGSLLSDEEYARQKAGLIKEKARLQRVLDDTDNRMERWLEIGERTFDFACHARYWFANGTSQEKAAILQALGSNLILKDRKLNIELKKPLMAIGRIAERVPQVKGTFEPEKSGANKGKMAGICSRSPVVLGGMDKVRTYLMRQLSLDPYSFSDIEEVCERFNSCSLAA